MEIKQNINRSIKEINVDDWRIGTWNVRGINGKEMELLEIVENKDYLFIAVTETKKKGIGTKVIGNGHLLIYGGVLETENASGGVACLVRKDIVDKIHNWEYINQRLLKILIERERNDILTIVIVYAPNEDAKAEEKNKFWLQLQETIQDYTGKLIILGDFNARVGNQHEKWQGVIGNNGEATLNNNGKRFIEFCNDNNLIIANTFYNHKEIHKITREVPQRNEKSIIDYVVTTRENRKSLKDVRVKRGYEIGSDHFFLEAKFKQDKRKEVTNAPTNTEFKSKIRSYRLRENELKEKYMREVDNKLDTITIEQSENINYRWEHFKKILINVATEICGVIRKGDNRRKTSWWSEHVRREVNEKKKLWKAYIQNKNQQNYEIYKEQRIKVKIMIKEAKQKSWEEFGEKLEENSKENQKLFYKTLKNMRNKTETRAKSIKDRNGQLISDEKDIMDRWKEYFYELLNDEKYEQRDETNRYEENTNLGNEIQETENIITERELEEALEKLKIGKAAGVDEIDAELIKYLGTNGKKELLNIYNLAWKNKCIPEEWNTSIIYPIYKRGDPKDCNNYRGISLLCTALKVYESIIEKKVRNIVEIQLADEQSGFRPAHSVHDHIFTIQQVIEKTLVNGETVYLGFIDMKKAFDMVNRERIWNSLENKGVNMDIIETIKSLYRTTNNQIRTCNLTSQNFVNKQGVRQGGILSPLLFICIIDEVIKESWSQTTKYTIGYYKLQPVKIEACAFADDIVLVAKSERELEININVWVDILKKYNLIVNNEKTKVMAISHKEENINIRMGEETLEQVEVFKYLGIILNNKGTQEKEIGNRIKIATKTYNAIYKKFLNKKEISPKTKLTVYNTVYTPILIYGAENWVLNKNQMNRLQAAEMRYLRKVAGVKRTDKLRNEYIRDNLKTKPLKSKIEERKLKWAGHLIRMDNTRQVKKIWEAKKIGKNRRGRPRKTWNNSVAEILKSKGKSWKEARILAGDRKKWRNFVEEK